MAIIGRHVIEERRYTRQSLGSGGSPPNKRPTIRSHQLTFFKIEACNTGGVPILRERSAAIQYHQTMDCHVAALLTKMAGGSVQGMFLGSRVKPPFYMAHRVMASERPASSMRGRAIAKRLIH